MEDFILPTVANPFAAGPQIDIESLRLHARVISVMNVHLKATLPLYNITPKPGFVRRKVAAYNQLLESLERTENGQFQPAGVPARLLQVDLPDLPDLF